MLDWRSRKSTTSSETAMAAGNKSSQAGAPHKRHHKFNAKRDPKPEVLAEANRTVLRIALAVGIGFLVVVAFQVLW
jgi:hypothetical protein